MPWQLAVAFSVIANVLVILIERRYAQRSTLPATFPPVISYLLGVLPVGFFAGLVLLPHQIYWSWWLGLLLVIEGAAMAISNWTMFKVIGKMAVAPFQTINRFYVVVVILFGWTVLGEGLTTYQFIGATILLAAALLAIWAPLNGMTKEHRKLHAATVTLALISAGTLGIGLVTEKAILGHMQVGGGFLVGWTAQTIAMLILALKDLSRTNLRKLNKREIQWSTLMGLTNGLTGAFYVYAIFHADNVSLVTSLTTMTLPLTVLGAFVFLHERENHKLMWASLALSFAGLMVTSLR